MRKQVEELVKVKKELKEAQQAIAANEEATRAALLAIERERRQVQELVKLRKELEASQKAALAANEELYKAAVVAKETEAHLRARRSTMRKQVDENVKVKKELKAAQLAAKTASDETKKQIAILEEALKRETDLRLLCEQQKALAKRLVEKLETETKLAANTKKEHKEATSAARKALAALKKSQSSLESARAENAKLTKRLERLLAKKNVTLEHQMQRTVGYAPSSDDEDFDDWQFEENKQGEGAALEKERKSRILGAWLS